MPFYQKARIVDQIVAITGTGVVSPNGNSPSQVWDNWREGHCAIRTISEPWSSKVKTRIASRCTDFPISLEQYELRRLDRCTQLAISAAQQAWAGASAMDIVSERVGVAMSSGIGGLETLYKGFVDMEAREIPRANPNTLPMAMPNSSAAHISMMINASGDIAAPNSACAGGAEAIAIAAQWIIEKHVDIAIAGGCEAMVNRLGIKAFESLGALSPDVENQPQPFGVHRNGFVLGEGAGAVVLEHRNHAIQRGAHIYGWVLGWGSSADAYHLTASKPDGIHAKRAIENALRKAELDIDDISLVKAHATGTKHGDLAEALVLNGVWGEGARKPLVIAPKSEIGHCISASGAIELIMALTCLKNGFAPGQARPYELDSILTLPFASKTTRIQGRIGLCNSFGFGGKNQSLVIMSE